MYSSKISRDTLPRVTRALFTLSRLLFQRDKREWSELSILLSIALVTFGALGQSSQNLELFREYRELSRREVPLLSYPSTRVARTLARVPRALVESCLHVPPPEIDSFADLYSARALRFSRCVFSLTSRSRRNRCSTVRPRSSTCGSTGFPCSSSSTPPCVSSRRVQKKH